MKLFKQKGAALIIFALILGLAATAFFISQLDGARIRIERDKKTSLALAEAKAALIGFATRSGVATGAARPGELPCPDSNNNGTANAPCVANVIGRLPWSTLGIDDLRDGYGERLWYAVSSNYENSTRATPLNSETLGTITLRNTSGLIINNGSIGSGLVAVIFSVGPPIRRQDAVNQLRSAANQNNPTHYLDVALGEDNRNFINSNVNGFIQGPILDANGGIVLNDKIITISYNDIIEPVEKRVIAAVSNALLDFYCAPDSANYVNKSCDGATGNQFYPNPALFSDTTCLGFANAGPCNSNLLSNRGRLPVTLISGSWNTTSILRGFSTTNWFQRNGWREQIHYAVAPACIEGTLNCDGAGGFLTLNFAMTNPVNRVIITTAGRVQLAQIRALNTDKQNEINYLEDENIAPLDDVFTRTVAAAVTFNDRSVNIPQ